MVRILQSVNNMARAGLETMLMNYYRHMDRSVIQFDFLTHRPWRDSYDEEIESLGGKVYYAPRLYIRNLPSYFRFMKTFFAEHKEYTVIHSHIDAMSYFPLLAAKKNGVPVRIAHSHNSKYNRDLKIVVKYPAQQRIPAVANVYCACGEMAGKFMFREKPFRIIRNAIDLKRFAYDPSVRERVRAELNLSDSMVIGHIGRLTAQKNQSKLLDIFREYKKINPHSFLLLVGKGEDEEKLRRLVSEYKLDESVLFLGDRPDPERLYQAMDLFVMPSLYEGLPVVGVEAQANGLPCLFSDTISSEVLLTDSAQMMPLNAGALAWAEKIAAVNLLRNQRAGEQLREKGYDIELEAKKLQEWYLSLANNVRL